MLFRRPIRASLLVALACLLGAAAWAASGRLLNEHRFRAAQEAAAQRDFVRAAAYLATCVEAMPDSGKFRLLAAQTARRTHDFGLANEHLGACQRLAYEPQTVELEWTLLAAQTGRFAEHESFLRGLVEQDHPEASPILEVLIDGYIQHFNMRSALHCLDLYLEREPNNLQAWLGRGHVCERLFHWTGAVTAYRRAVDLVPEDYEARLRLASALIVVGPANEAAAEFELLLRLRPRDPEALLGLVRCRRQQNRLEEAQQLLNELTSLRPDDGPVLLERGRLALAGGNPKGAEAWLRKAVERSPCDRETRYALYQCLQQQGKDTEARESMAVFKRLDADLKRIDVLTNQMQKTPYDPSLYHEAGMLCLRNGSEDEGVRWLHLALRYDAGHQPSHAALADFYEAAGKPALAARHRQPAEARGKK